MAVLLPSANVTSAGPLNAGSLNFASTAMVDAPTLVLRVRETLISVNVSVPATV